MIKNFQLKIRYCSPDTDEPFQIFESKPFFFSYVIEEYNPQIDFEDGSYLMFREMLPLYMSWFMWFGEYDEKGEKIWQEVLI